MESSASANLLNMASKEGLISTSHLCWMHLAPTAAACSGISASCKPWLKCTFSAALLDLVCRRNVEAGAAQILKRARIQLETLGERPRREMRVRRAGLAAVCNAGCRRIVKPLAFGSPHCRSAQAMARRPLWTLTGPGTMGMALSSITT
eukprot:423024-Alexandrium_andersonii.AAC.1